MIHTYKQQFAQILADATQVSTQEIYDLVEIPPENIDADLAFPCFLLAKIRQQAPVVIAQQLAGQLQSEFFSSFSQMGPYVNAHINKTQFLDQILSDQIEDIKSKNVKVLIEYMSANPNKPLHIGQARNVCIGDTMTRVAKKIGYDVHTSNYGDDSGVNVGYNIVGHLYYDMPLETDKKFDHYCGDVYMSMRKKDEDPEFKQILSKTLLTIEQQSNEKINELHYTYTRKCALEQIKTCRRMNATFDLINWETDILHLNFFAQAMQLLKEKGWVRYVEEGEAQGCWIIDLSSLPAFAKEEKQYQILIKSDGVATYIAKDIAFAMWKLGYLEKDFFYEQFAEQPDGSMIYTTETEEKHQHTQFGNYNTAITVIDIRQIPAQSVVKGSLELLEFVSDTKQYLPLGYGIVFLTPKTLQHFGFDLTEGEKQEKRLPFASRRGRTVTIDDMMDLLHKKAYFETKKRNPGQLDPWLDEVAEAIALSSLRFFLIKSDISKDIVFDLDEAMDMEAESGAYVLYAYARLSSVLTQAQVDLPVKDTVDIYTSLLTHELEFELAKKISEQHDVLERTYVELAPHYMCRYILELAKLFNSYYAHVKVIDADKNIQKARILLLQKVQKVLKESIELIGMKTVDRM